MEKTLKELTIKEFQYLISSTMKKSFEEISEDIIALSSPSYINSIKEAREDYLENKTKSFDEVFDV